MKPNPDFRNRPKSFWAHVRSISQQVGYTVRGRDQVKVPSFPEMTAALRGLDLDPSRIADESAHPTELGAALGRYFQYRAEALNQTVKANLMDAEEAQALFLDTRNKAQYTCNVPMNKQKGEKRNHAYLTGLVNMTIEGNIGGHPCDYEPRTLTTVTAGGAPLRTLARWVDGAFPSNVNPIAIWEVKEYYYTTTFGSRIADGIYETLLDGMEIEELQQSEQIEVKHYLMIDGKRTWWSDGKSYLCRIIDMLHMGYVDEVLIGREVVTALPEIARSWVAILEQRN